MGSGSELIKRGKWSDTETKLARDAFCVLLLEKHNLT